MRRVPIALTAMFILAMIVAMLSGCAGVQGIDTPMVVENHTCRFVIARAGKYPWNPQQCLAKCADDKETSFFYGCSSESLLSEVKSATGVIPTAPVW